MDEETDAPLQEEGTDETLIADFLDANDADNNSDDDDDSNADDKPADDKASSNIWPQEGIRLDWTPPVSRSKT